MIEPGLWIFRRNGLPRAYEAFVERQLGQIHIYVDTSGLHILGDEQAQNLAGIYWFDNSPAATPPEGQEPSSRVNLELSTTADNHVTLRGRPKDFANPESWEFSK